MPPSLSTEQYAETLLVVFINFFICFFGLLFTALSFFTIQHAPIFDTHQRILFLNHSGLNFSGILIYFLWVTPATYTQSVEAAGSIFGKIIGQIYTFIWISIIWSHILLSLCSLLSVHIPSRNQSIFSRQNCIFCLIFIFSLSFFEIGPLFAYETCFIAYQPATWQWSAPTKKSCATYRLLVLQLLSDLLLVVTVVGNCATWIFAVVKRKNLRNPKEFRLFLMIFARNLGFLIFATLSSFCTGLVKQQWKKYALTSLSWQVYHLFDSAILVFTHFHRKLLAEHHPEHVHPPTMSWIHVDQHGSHHGGSPNHRPMMHYNAHVTKVDTY